jgi:hypothetical protein
VQEIDLPGYETGAPTYWNGRVYVTPGSGSNTVQAYAVSNGLLNLAAVSPIISSGGHSFITSDGNANGILWTSSLRVVYALDAVTLKILYSTSQATNARDVPPAPLPHIPMPIVANGRLYLGTTKNLTVYGLLPSLTLMIDGGGAQTAPVLTRLPTPLGIFAKDEYKNPVAGVAVTFSDGGAGGTFSANPVITNAKGFASVSYTTSTKAEKVTIKASASCCASTTWIETVTPGPAKTITVLSGNNQSGKVSELLPLPLVSKVTDQHSNPVPGVSVTYSAGGAGGSFSSNPVTTDFHGNATVRYTTPSVAGKVTIQTTVVGVSSRAIFAEAAH